VLDSSDPVFTDQEEPASEPFIFETDSGEAAFIDEGADIQNGLAVEGASGESQIQTEDSAFFGDAFALHELEVTAERLENKKALYDFYRVLKSKKLVARSRKGVALQGVFSVGATAAGLCCLTYAGINYSDTSFIGAGVVGTLAIACSAWSCNKVRNYRNNVFLLHSMLKDIDEETILIHCYDHPDLGELLLTCKSLSIIEFFDTVEDLQDVALRTKV
jgi:hypothetical protein